MKTLRMSLMEIELVGQELGVFWIMGSFRVSFEVRFGVHKSTKKPT